MIKECNIILRNDKVAVVLFDSQKIQVPNTELIGEKAYLRFEHNKYTVVSKDDFEKLNAKKESDNSKRRKKKNETNNIVMDNEEVGI